MRLPVRAFMLLLLLAGLHRAGIAQTTLTTGSLLQTAICPGTSLEVPFSLAGTVNPGNGFSIQLLKGSDVVTFPATTVIGNSVTGAYVATFVLSGTLTAGTYQVRVVGSNPVTVGSVSPTPLFVKMQPPAAPTLFAQAIGNYTSQFTFCQDDTAFPLSNLVGSPPDNYRILYDIGTGLAPTGQQTLVSPFLSTATAGSATYSIRFVVIDNTKGCNPIEQPGSVAYLRTEVKPRPATPSLSAKSLTYCQFQSALPLEATVSGAAQSLRWYDPDGNQLVAGIPTPATTQTGTVTYQVSQVLNQCEGPRASIAVSVRPASALPTTPRARVEYCRGTIAQPLVATGTGLVWTDPTGTTSTVAPTPTTLNASKTTDGEVYYVTQTSPNGCPSAQLPIRVVIQAQPTLSLSGGTNVNLGVEVPLRLTFTGTGPYQYRILTNPAGTTLMGSATRDTTLLLLAQRSATYQVAEVSNGCGTGLPGNPATTTVVVLIPTIRTSPLQTATACAGGTITANFQTTGSFNSSNVFRLQIARTNADTTKLSYTDLVIMQQVGSSQLTGILPATATSGTYLVRVVATNPKIPIVGAPSSSTLVVIGQASALLTTTTPTITDGEVAKLVVTFTGDSPWTFSYRDSTNVAGPVQTVTTSTNPYLLDVKPRATTSYRLTSVSNGCSLNTNVPGQAVIRVSPLLAIEPPTRLLHVFPVPATSTVTVQIDPSLLTEMATLTLVNEKGQTILTKSTQQQNTSLWLADQPAGLYVVRVQVGGQKVSHRLVKQ